MLSDQLADIIRNNKGEVRLLADVQKIELEGDKAVGVTYQDRKSKETVSVYGKHIIANCGPENIYNGNMVPAKYSEPVVKDYKDGSSLFSVYITFKEALSKKYPDMAYSTFIVQTLDLNSPLSAVTRMNKEEPIEDRDFVLVDYSAIDSGLVKEGDPRSFACFGCTSLLSEWENLSPEEYKSKKEKVAQAFFAKAEQFYPGITENIDRYEVATPKTIQRYLKTPSGTAYGYKQLPGNSVIKRAPFRASQIKNLHYTGAWGFSGGGFTGAIISGYATATDLLLA